MALGVLNNLAAVYAENNLNSTSNSLQTVLQQLSSGSKINSGADDAAGLSLINGLTANSTALTQSATNATEGVGLLRVADGALSQVTSLLNRAITLATEASNGTLNTSQAAAANQEYESILSEINNIGSTTTYNQERVFSGNTISIYTGDSSTAGSSIDNLNIRTLSASSVGDTGGAMTYSNGQSNVFVNLSTATTNAAVTDSLNGSGATSITVQYLNKGSNGSPVQSTATISVGTGTSYANTAQGLIQAINNAGLGLSATFTTAANAGTSAVASALGKGTETGILITGDNLGTGYQGANADAGIVGTLSIGNGGAYSDTLSGTLNLGSNSIALGKANSTDTLQDLATTINNGNYGVTAVYTANATTLTLLSADSTETISGVTLSDANGGGATLSLSNVPTAGANMSTTPGPIGTFTLSGTGVSTDTLAGTMSIVGANGISHSITISAGNGNNTLATLSNYINGLGLGVTAAVNGASLTVSSSSEDSMATVNYSGITDSTHATATMTSSGITTPPVAYYSTALSTTGITDTTTTGGTATTVMTTDTDGSSGTATISYSDNAGVNLSGTDLLTATDAQKALAMLNEAITDVASMDGYLGAQINTLQSVSSVLTTQSENVISAQNAVQATDYASATSNMSKYEVLSQTGIAALAQANTVQQEVTKLLQ